MKPRHRFQNVHPHAPHTLSGLLRWKLGLAKESAPVSVTVAPESTDDRKMPPTIVHSPLEREQVRVTWIGHSTFLIQHQGLNILTDPIFGNCQPISFGGMKRANPPVPDIGNLPQIDFVLISHSHYDHLDLPSIRVLSGKVEFWVPTGLSNGLPNGNSALVASWVGGNLQTSRMAWRSIIFLRSMARGGGSLIVIERYGVAGC
jgi:hypothetical protein